MADKYEYRRLVRRKLLHRHPLTIALTTLITVVLGIAAFMFINEPDTTQDLPTSETQSHHISDNLKTFQSTYFQFQDRGNWVLNERESGANAYVYYRYRGLLVEHQLSIFINETPNPIDLATTRTLPIRIVNSNSFDITNVSDPCEKYSNTRTLDKGAEISINGAQMLCDPNTPSQYSVIVSEINGDYKVNLRRQNGTLTQYVILYRNLTANPEPYTIKNIVSSFRAL